MKYSIFLFCFMGNMAAASPMCTLTNSWDENAIEYTSFWSNVQNYCADSIEQLSDGGEHIYVKDRVGGRNSGHILTRLIRCHKIGTNVNCYAREIWSKGQSLSKGETFRVCRNNFDVSVENNNAVSVDYDSPARGDYGSHSVAKYSRELEYDGDVLSLQWSASGYVLPKVMFGGNGLTDFDCKVFGPRKK